MSYQPSEIADLVLLVALGPVVILLVHRFLPRFPSAGYVAYGAMLCSYVFTIAEAFFYPELLNMFEHLGYAVAGIAFAVVAAQVRRIVGSSPPEQSR